MREHPVRLVAALTTGLLVAPALLGVGGTAGGAGVGLAASAYAASEAEVVEVTAPGSTGAGDASRGGLVGSGGEPTRLLVTYADPVDGLAADAVAHTASVVTDAGGEPAGTGPAPADSAVRVLEFDEPSDAAAAARHLAARADVVAVEPDVLLYPTNGEVAAVTTSADDLSLAPANWWLRNDGGTVGGVPGRRGVDVGAADAWAHATGRGVVVAVIDSGADISHPSLRDRLWVNPAESPNGRDDDGNGYVDDVHGWNFVDRNGEVFRSADADAHGTHVAGIVVGEHDPATGARGAAPGARVMVLRFIDGNAGRTSHAIEAIRYAVDNGADVINASWGSTEPSTALRTVLEEVPIPVVVSAGNLGAPLEEQPSYPAAWGLPNVISVAAVDHTGAMASFSSTSRSLVDVAAPGVRIVGPWPDGRYASASGTSQAAPLVTAAVALALERHPELAGVEVADAVRASVRPLAGADETRSGGIVRAAALLDHLGTRVPACGASGGALAFEDVPSSNVHRDAVACMVALGVTRGVTDTRYGIEQGLTRAQIATMVSRALDRAGVLPAAPEVGRFEDVTAGSVHRDAIETLAEVGVMPGASATRFAPERTVTRAELAAVTARAAEFVAAGELRNLAPAFVDTAGVAAEQEIAKAAGLRIVLGRDDGRFEPDAPVRRDQAASMVTRLLDRLVQQGLIDAA